MAVIKIAPNETGTITIDLSKKITTVLSRFPINFFKDGENKSFFPMQTMYTMTNGDVLFANTYLASDITQAMTNNKKVLHGAKTITLKISRQGTGTETRYTVEAV